MPESKNQVSVGLEHETEVTEMVKTSPINTIATHKTVAFDPNTQTGIGGTLKEAWQIIKKTWVNLLVWTVVWQSVSSLAFMILLAILVVIGWNQLGREAFSSVEAFLARWQTWVPLIGWGLAMMMVVSSVVGLLISLGQVLVVGSYQQPMELGAVFSKSFKLFMPFLLTGLMVSFLTIGGFGFFGIPGIFITLAVVFWGFEVVFAGVSYMQAIKNSLTMVKQNLIMVVERWLVAVGLSIGWSLLVVFVLGVASVVPGLVLVFQLGGQILSVVFGWFVLAFWYLAYRQVRSKTDFAKPTSSTWMWVVAVMGWLLITVMIGAIYTGIKAVLPDIIQSIRDEVENVDKLRGDNWQNQMEWQNELNLNSETNWQEELNVKQDMQLRQQIEAELERMRAE